MSAFLYPYTIRFQDCDPAGIVFYPRFFEMMNATVEAWFAGPLGLDWHSLHKERGQGVPLVKTESTFLKPSRLSEKVVMHMVVERLGRSSIDLRFELRGPSDDVRLQATQTVAMVDFTLDPPKAVPISDDLRDKMQAYLG